MIHAIVEERREHGLFKNMKDFVTRMAGREVNKRAIENFIKSGAFDCLEGNRHQKIMVYPRIMDSVMQEKKNAMAGQMTLFDIVGEEDKKAFEISLPDVPEYEKEVLLGFEKEVLGVYISGHPLENYTAMMEKNITAITSDFQPDDEIGAARVRDGQQVVVGGIITEKTIKYTKNNKVMAFLTLEDLVGTVEVIVFPRDYEKNQLLMDEESKVFIRGRVAAEDERASKMICEQILSFQQVPRELWIQFQTKQEYYQREVELLEDLKDCEGNDSVVIYIQRDKAMKRLPSSRNIGIDSAILGKMQVKYGQNNIKVVEKSIEKLWKMH